MTVPVVNPELNVEHPATRAMFAIATCSLTDEDRSQSQRLGIDLYGHLTRPVDEPLAFGPGIPVSIDVDLNWNRNADDRLAALAEHLLLVIVAGTDSVLLEPHESANRLEHFDCPGTGVSKLLVPTDGRWRSEARRMPSVTVSGAVFGQDEFADVVDSVLLAARRCLDQIAQGTLTSGARSDVRPSLYLSLTPEKPVQPVFPSPSTSQGNRSSLLSDYFSTIGWAADTVTRDAESRGPLDAVMLSVHRESSAKATWIDRALILAKRNSWPVVEIAASNDCTGQGLIDWEQAIRVAAIEHLRASYFHLTAQSLVRASRLPVNTAICLSAPDLFDLTIGQLKEAATRLVLYPDPALTPEKREVIREAAPLVHIVTPSTLVGRGGCTSSHSQQVAENQRVTPLDRIRVGVSVSEIPENDFRLGQTTHHLQDAMVQITRSLVAGGASITYGGHFLVGECVSFTQLLAKLIEAYNQTAVTPAERLQVFQSIRSELTDIPGEIKCRVRHMSKSENLALPSILTAYEIDQLPGGVEYSDMRNAMTAETDARVAIGGKPFPKNGEQGDGYSGRFPGIAEEVFRALRADQPVYLIGGYGGITRRLARLMESPKTIDAFWDDQRYGFNKEFTSLAWDVDNHPAAERLKLPKDLMSLANQVARFSSDLEDDEDAWLDFNGLTLAENRAVWNSVDPILLSSLIVAGLVRWRTRRTSMRGRHQIEVIHGDVTAVTGADVLAISVFDDVDPQGAGAAIDRVTSGIVRQAQHLAGRLIGVQSDQLDVDYLCALSLGNVAEDGGASAALAAAIQRSASEIMELCVREGFRSVAIVTFGGSTLEPFAAAVRAMLVGFSSFHSDILIKWVEADADKFSELVRVLDESGMADITTVLQHSEKTPSVRYPWFNLNVKLHDDVLDVSVLDPEGTGVRWTRSERINSADLNSLCRGAGTTGNQTPREDDLLQRGIRLSQMLFGDEVEDFWRRCHDLPLAISHNQAASRIQFELMRFDLPDVKEQSPSLTRGVHRWLAVAGGRMSSSFGRPRLSRNLHVGLIIDPTGDLPGARKEGEMVRRILGGFGSDVHLQVLGGHEKPATVDNVVDLLRQVDVLHYCGHAFFSDVDRSESGLLLAGQETLTSAKLETVSPIPRVMIFNACQAGRVRGQAQVDRHNSFSLAEMVLRGGVEAFLGTFWEVDDRAAELFAGELYTQLRSGMSLRESVTIARRKLKQNGQRDWANYCLYGDGRFRLA